MLGPSGRYYQMTATAMGGKLQCPILSLLNNHNLRLYSHNQSIFLVKIIFVERL